MTARTEGPGRAVAALAAAAAAFPALLLATYADGPPPAHTGGFGEPSCHACHFGGPLNEPTGSLELRVEGPAAGCGDGRKEPSRLVVTLARPGMAAAGFQLSVRHADSGRQAGQLVALDGMVEVVEDPETGISYARQTAAGTGLVAPDSARWHVGWRPPAAGGAVVSHAAANAANDDASEFGDFIYLIERRVSPAREGCAKDPR